MNGIYLAKDKMNEQDLIVCQMILWRTGDALYKRNDYLNALLWYQSTWSLCLTISQDHNNILVLARKIAFCYLESDDADTAFACLEEAMRGSKISLAVDCLFLLQIGIARSSCNSDQATELLGKLIKSQDFTCSMLSMAASICYKARNKLLLKTLLEYAMKLKEEYGTYDEKLTSYTLEVLRCGLSV
ncbi:hypothetical protein DFQ30_003200 [Apophysomyces sp. BC1015]|nr:hypothetical protein DFQ30_003200 [Apophysomyces sp. BC1015]